MDVVILVTSPHGKTSYLEEMSDGLIVTTDLRRAEVYPDFIAEEMIQAMYAMPRHQPGFPTDGHTFATAELILSTGTPMEIADVGVDIEANYRIHNR